MPPNEQNREQELTTRALRRSLRRRLVSSYGQSTRDASGLLQRQHTSDARARQAAAAEARPHVDAPVTVPNGLPAGLDGHMHNHNDPLTTNSISRTTGDVETAHTADPT